MANLNYYASEIDSLLRQVSVNELDIGMQRLNLLPVPDGELTIEQSDLPSSAELAVIGDTANGSITVSLSGEAEVPPTITVLVGCGKLTPRGKGSGATGTLIPGTYSVTLGGSESAASMPWDEYRPPMLYVAVRTSEGTTSYSTNYDGETTDIVVPNDYTEVEFTLYLYIDSFDEAASCQLYPFLRLKTLEDEPFEPYKPDLQTQITSNSARTADALGTDGSINLFPIDKGEWGNPVIFDVNIGFFVVMQANSGHGWPSVVAFAGESTFTTADSVEYKTFVNCGYRFGDDKRLWGDLVPGDYTLSFDIFGDSSFFDVGKFRFEVYAKASMPDVDYGDLIAMCTGTAVDFTVTAEKPFILIVAVAERLEGHSWNGAEIYAVPFLRRKIFATAARDEYQPPIKKQLAEIRYQISALRSLIVNNVIQTDKITDTSEEGPLT